MSIVASVKVLDGIALGADSMTQIWGSHPVTGVVGMIKSYQHAKKLFQVNDSPLGVMTYGIGNIGKRSIESLVRDFHMEEIKSKTVEEIAKTFQKYLLEKYDKEFQAVTEVQKPQLGIYLAGYTDKEEEHAMEYEFIFPNEREIVKLVRAKEIFGASWRGISAPFTRLFFGNDPQLKTRLEQIGLPKEKLDEALNGFALPVAFDGMPLQDAIDFLVFILKTTIGTSTFCMGAPVCGEPIDVAIITPEKKFQWIKQKQLKFFKEEF